MSVYTGRHWQRGYGLGSVFGSLFKAAIPLLKTTGKTLAKRALKTGAQTGIALAQDALAGRNMKQAAKARVTDALLQEVSRGLPIKRKRKQRKASRGRSAKRARRSKDIFD